MHPLPIADKPKAGRCLGVASDKRQDHASGTLKTRPSIKYAMMASDVTLTSRILGSLLSTMLMPCLRYGIAVNSDKSPNDA